MTPELLALALTVVPFLIGFGAGALAGGRARLLPALVFLPIPLCVFAAVRLRIGLWDGAFVGAMAVLGALAPIVFRKDRRARTILALVSTVVALGLAEGAVRGSHPAVSGIPPREIPTLVLPQAHAPNLHDPNIRDQWPPNGACAMMFPNDYPELFEARTSVRKQRPKTVLHVGDSMVVGWSVPPENAFAALMQAQDTTANHVNGAIQNTTLDVQALIIRAWVRKLRPDLVVLYPFAGSDLIEMDESFPCCHDGPLLDYANGSATPRCAQPDFSAEDSSFAWIRDHSPAPEPLRALAPWSELARSAVLSFRHDLHNQQPFATQWTHYEAALRALRDDLKAQGVPLLVVVLPAKRGLGVDPRADNEPVQQIDDPREIAHGLAVMSRQLGIDTIDASAFFRGLVREGGLDRWFVGDQIHFSVEGHARFAAWLLPQVDGRLLK
jgi:hypothetical protein